MGIETYRVKLKLLGPVHIGSGMTLRKKDYIYDFHNSEVHFINGPKLMNYLKSLNLLDKYYDFLQYSQGRNSKESDLKYFFEKSNIKKSDWPRFVDFKEHVNQGKRNSRMKSKPLNDVHLMVRDGQNQVYIPGSSLKGAIKTALLGINDNSSDKDLYNKLRVSDSLPISTDCLAIYEKIDINKVDKPMPLYRECIEVGTEINMEISIVDKAFDINHIEAAIRSFYENYNNKWLLGFNHSRIGRQVLSESESPHQNILYLGGGTGFASKTLHYQHKNKLQAKQDMMKILKKRFRNTYGKMRHIPENVPIVLKATYNQALDSWYQQGMCEVSFEKINEV